MTISTLTRRQLIGQMGYFGTYAQADAMIAILNRSAYTDTDQIPPAEWQRKLLEAINTARKSRTGTTYHVSTYGYELNTCELTLKQARMELKNLVAESMDKCRLRFGRATKHKVDDFTYRITIGRDFRSALYANHTIKQN